MLTEKDTLLALVSVDHVLQLTFQGVGIEFRDIIEKELVHPKCGHGRLVTPYGPGLVEEKDVPRDAMPPLPVSQP